MNILLAFIADCIAGDPVSLPHPVCAIGSAISFYEKKLYAKSRLRGLFEVLLVLLTTAVCVTSVLWLAARINRWLFAIVNIYLLYAALAYKSLKKEALTVEKYLQAENITEARRRLSGIVGRDTEKLSEKMIIRADIETVAEGYVDGVASPLFWMVIGFFFNAPALFVWLYKAANTMDSMIGYDDERYREFGFCAAKLDDIMNFIPARIGALFALVAGALIGYDIRAGWKIFIRDRKKHKSPNSAHGESVWAGLLRMQLGGGAYYSGEFEARPTLGDALREPEIDDIRKATDILTAASITCVLAATIAEILI